MRGNVLGWLVRLVLIVGSEFPCSSVACLTVFPRTSRLCLVDALHNPRYWVNVQDCLLDLR